MNSIKQIQCYYTAITGPYTTTYPASCYRWLTILNSKNLSTDMFGFPKE